MIALLAREVLAENPGAPIIADVKSSDMLFEEIARLGGEPVMYKTGHSLIKAKMQELNSPLAGEMSGHIFMADRYYGFDDALYVAIRFAGLVAASSGGAATLLDSLPVMVNTPEMRIDCAEERKFSAVEEVRARLHQAGAKVNEVDGVRVSRDGGWWYKAKNVAQRDEASVTICALQALRAANNTGVFVDKLTIEQALGYIRKCQNADGGIRSGRCCIDATPIARSFLPPIRRS